MDIREMERLNKIADDKIQQFESEKKRIKDHNTKVMDEHRLFLEENPGYPFKSAKGLILEYPVVPCVIKYVY